MRKLSQEISVDLMKDLIVEFMSKTGFLNDNEDVHLWSLQRIKNGNFLMEVTVKEV